MSQDTNSLILQLYARTPAPCRDYIGLTITNTEVVINIWNITYGPHVYPKRQRCSLEDFEQAKYFQNEVSHFFGKHVLEYVMRIAKKEQNLQNLPSKIFHHILKYLAVKDISNLSQTSKIMFERCNTESSWKILFRTYFKQDPDRQDAVFTNGFGWKDIFKQKIKKEVFKSKKNVHKVSAATNFQPKTVMQNNLRNSTTNLNPMGLRKTLKNVGKSANITTKTNCLKSTSTLVVSKPPTQNNLKANQTKSVANLCDNQTRVRGNIPNQKPTQRPSVASALQRVSQNMGNNTKIDSTKSASALSAPKTAVQNNLKVNQVKSAANLNNAKNTTNKLLSRNKNDLKLNNVKLIKNAEIKFEIPKELEQYVTSNKVSSSSKYKMQNVAAKDNTVSNCKTSVPFKK